MRDVVGPPMRDVLTIREAIARAKAEGLPVSEYALREWIRAGIIPVRHAGNKALVYYPNLVRYLRCEDGGDPVNLQGETKLGDPKVENVTRRLVRSR